MAGALPRSAVVAAVLAELAAPVLLGEPCNGGEHPGDVAFFPLALGEATFVDSIIAGRPDEEGVVFFEAIAEGLAGEVVEREGLAAFVLKFGEGGGVVAVAVMVELQFQSDEGELVGHFGMLEALHDCDPAVEYFGV